MLSATLDQRHAGIADYQLVVPQQLFRQHQKTQRIFQVVMAAIAGVSLLVGGIGIMNIMLANVLERRREIGLLRALGARKRDVIAQFLREASVICIVGALLGLLLGAVPPCATNEFAACRSRACVCGSGVSRDALASSQKPSRLTPLPHRISHLMLAGSRPVLTRAR